MWPFTPATTSLFPGFQCSPSDHRARLQLQCAVKAPGIFELPVFIFCRWVALVRKTIVIVRSQQAQGPWGAINYISVHFLREFREIQPEIPTGYILLYLVQVPSVNENRELFHASSCCSDISLTKKPDMLSRDFRERMPGGIVTTAYHELLTLSNDSVSSFLNNHFHLQSLPVVPGLYLTGYK